MSTQAMMRSKRTLLLLAATLSVGAAHGGHRLPPPIQNDRQVPAEGFNLSMLDQLQHLAEYITKRTVRVEALHRPEPPFDSSILSMEDGAGVVIAEGRLLTTARYLEGAETVQVMRRDGTPISAEVLRLDPEEGLALLSFDPEDLPGTAVLPGFAPIPPPHQEGAASEVVIPLHLVGRSVSVRVAGILDDPETIFLSGQLANGIPAFDRYGRLVALADRPTPDRSRSVAFGALFAEAWLENKTAPAEVIPRGPGP